LADSRPVILASASPRRLELLRAAGARPAVEPSRFDEGSVRDLPPRAQALAAARGKAMDVAGRRPNSLVIGADTVVALGRRALGKPRDAGDAAAMLTRLGGRDHHVHSAICLVAPGGRRVSGLSSSVVRFNRLTRARILTYVAGGEPIGKAGAYAIQGEAAEFAHVVRGRRDTVIGLSTGLLLRLLRQIEDPLAKTLSDNLDPS
jgi:septum formation protein